MPSRSALLTSTALILATWLAVAQLLVWREERLQTCLASGGIFTPTMIGRCIMPG